jgi:hypothetical protein
VISASQKPLRLRGALAVSSLGRLALEVDLRGECRRRLPRAAFVDGLTLRAWRVLRRRVGCFGTGLRWWPEIGHESSVLRPLSRQRNEELRMMLARCAASASILPDQ